MSLLPKLNELFSTLTNDGAIALYHRVQKSRKLRWYQWRGQKLNQRLGWRSNRPILVIESDDWGAEHIPGPEVLEIMKMCR